MKKHYIKNLTIIFGLTALVFLIFMTVASENVCAGAYDGEDLVLAILKNESTLISSTYEDMDQSGHRQSIVLSSLGTMVHTKVTPLMS